MNLGIRTAILCTMDQLEAQSFNYGKASKEMRGYMDKKAAECQDALRRLNIQFPAEYRSAYAEHMEFRAIMGALRIAIM